VVTGSFRAEKVCRVVETRWRDALTGSCDVQSGTDRTARASDGAVGAFVDGVRNIRNAAPRGA
jgi:hypothetical protein